MPPPPDLQGLLSRVALQDRQAFEQLYRATCRHLLGLAHGILQRRDLAEDVLQESFMNVWSGAGGFNPALASPMTWLINIVRNKAIDRLRSGRTARDALQPLDDEAMQIAGDPALQPERQLEHSLSKVQIDRCMAALGAEQKQALALAFYRGLVHTEIAEMLGAPLGSVKAWVRRGADRLRGCLEAAGVSGA